MSIDNKIDMYISTFPEAVQDKLRQLREAILENAPGVEEYFSYSMPAYRFMGKPLVYYAGLKKHIGFYAMPRAHEAFDDELSGYKSGKGSVKFPLNKELPMELINKIIKFKVIVNCLEEQLKE